MAISAEERALVSERLNASTHRLLTLTANLSPAQWTFRPAPDMWSIAEIAEHIIDLERRTLEGIEALLLLPESSPEALALTAGKEQRLLRHVPDRSRRVKAPPELVVSSRLVSPAQCQAEFSPLRARTAALVNQDGLDSRIRPHFAFRELTCFQWLLMLAVHTERHCLQMEEVMASEGYSNPAR